MPHTFHHLVMHSLRVVATAPSASRKQKSNQKNTRWRHRLPHSLLRHSPFPTGNWGRRLSTV